MTGICVTYNTADFIVRAIDSIRRFHPYLDIIIVDGSDANDPCRRVTHEMANSYTKVYNMGRNIGHGAGLDFGLKQCESNTALIFDSDIIMINSPLSAMLGMLSTDMYGIGWVYDIGRDGFDFGTPGRNHREAIPYLHPYFAIINVKQYFNYAPFVHHGAPCFKAMIDLYDHKLADPMLINFPGLGHTSGRGINWIGQSSPYIQHDFGGTRTANKQRGQKEIDGKWIR